MTAILAEASYEVGDDSGDPAGQTVDLYNTRLGHNTAFSSGAKAGIDSHSALHDFPRNSDPGDDLGPFRGWEVPGRPDELLEQTVDVNSYD
jgi:hypothetical protein